MGHITPHGGPWVGDLCSVFLKILLLHFRLAGKLPGLEMGNKNILCKGISVFKSEICDVLSGFIYMCT